jgi:small multidrug resistance pump
MSAWTYLGLGIVFEVIGTSFLKVSNGFSESVPSTLCVMFFVAALYMLSQSVRTLEIGVVYAIWSGVGIALISIIGVFFFNESVSLTKMGCIALIIIGVVGLQMATEGDGTGAKTIKSEDQ